MLKNLLSLYKVIEAIIGLFWKQIYLSITMLIKPSHNSDQ